MALFYKEIRWRRNKQKPAEPVPPALAARIAQHWDEPKALYEDVVEALEQGCMTAALEAATRLLAIDSQTERGFLLHSQVLLRMERLDDAELVLHQYLSQFGLSPTLLAHLGHIQLVREHWTYAAELLWQALEFDPNHAAALAWWEVSQVRQMGEDSAELAMERVAALPGAWRPLARLAAAAFRHEEQPEALDLWQKALAAAPEDGSAWPLVAGELVAAGALDLVLPHYEPATHGVAAGLPLLRALHEQGRAEEARGLWRRLVLFDTPYTRAELARYGSAFATAGG